MRSPIRWFGGKGMMVKKILPLLPSHRTYVEPFGGGASVLLAKDPSPVEVYNDVDSGLVSFFRALRDKKTFARLHGKLLLTPYSREEHRFCTETWDSSEDLVERAYRWYVACVQSFSGGFGQGWSSVVTQSRRGMASTAAIWKSKMELLPVVHQRLIRVQIEHRDWRYIVARYDRPETLQYIDPPYVQSTRSGGSFRHDMSDSEHAALVNSLLGLEGMAVVSGYDHRIYRRLDEAGWSKHEFNTACHAAGKSRTSGLLGPGSTTKHAPRTEVVWVSPRGQRGRNRG